MLFKISIKYEPWNPLMTVDWGLFWVEKLPVLTLSNKPFKLIASVDSFDRDSMWAVVAADFFNRDWKYEKWKLWLKFSLETSAVERLRNAPLLLFIFNELFHIFCAHAVSKQAFTIEINLCSFHLALYMSPWKLAQRDWMSRLFQRKAQSLMSDSKRLFIAKWFSYRDNFPSDD